MDQISPVHDVVTAIDIGGTHVTAAAVRCAARPHAGARAADPLAPSTPLGLRAGPEHRVALDAAAPAGELLDRIAAVAAAARAAAEDAVGPRLAIAIPGPFDYRAGQGDFAGVGKFSQLSGVDLRGELAARCGGDRASVRFVNDAEAYALGEWAAGAGAQAERMLALTLGTGIGSGFVASGRCVSEGPEVPTDGNIHTVTLDGAPLEERISRRALRESYAGRTGAMLDVVQIAERARGGEAAAQETLEEGMTLLGRALAPWLERFAAERLVIGGSMAGSADLLFPALISQLSTEMGRAPEVLRGALPAERAALFGAVIGTGSAQGARAR